MNKQPSKYTEIALDIATMIINGELVEGEKISGRSTLASKYNVSPETIRRAVTLIKDFGVVDSSPKNGIKVLSANKACEFINRNQNKTSIVQLKGEVTNIIHEKNQLDKILIDKINQMIDQLTIQKDIGILHPLEAVIPQNSHVIGKSISQTNFWQKTTATVISIKREDNTYLSPGPDWIFEAYDTIVFIGKKNSYNKVVEFIK